jgi:hypothetical protein
MANYHAVTKEEIEQYLLPQGFQEISLPNTRERVYAKRVDRVLQRGDDILGVMPLSLRVFSGIVGDSSRGVGEDAIRVTVFWRDADGQIKKASGSKRVHRVENWRHNLQDRIDHYETTLGPVCSCGAPMIERKPKDKTKKPFYGCARYPECKKTREM